MNENERNVGKTITAVVLGVAVGIVVIAAEIFGLTSSGYRLEGFILAGYVVLCAVYPFCMDPFARFEIPVWMSEYISPVTAVLIGSAYAMSVGETGDARMLLLKPIVLLNLLTLAVVAVRTVVSYMKNKRGEEE